MDSIIDLLQKNTSYTVTEIGTGEKKVNTINNYRAINSKHEEAKVIVGYIARVDPRALGRDITAFIGVSIAPGATCSGRRNPGFNGDQA